MKFFLKIYFFLLFIIFYIHCQSYLCRPSDSNNLKVGDTAYLCIHIIPTNSKMVFPIEVDEYSVASIKGISSQISSNDTNIEFLAQVGETTSIFPSVSIYNIK
jgi:hypothetical protein